MCQEGPKSFTITLIENAVAKRINCVGVMNQSMEKRDSKI